MPPESDTPGSDRPTLHERLERAIGVDVQLFYGLFVPAAIVVVLVVGLAISPTWWLLIPLVIVLLGAIGVVTVGILQMLADSDEEDDAEPE